MGVLFFKASFFKSVVFFLKSLALFNFWEKSICFDSFFCGGSLAISRLQLHSRLEGAMLWSDLSDFFYRTSLSFYFFLPFLLEPKICVVSKVKQYFRSTGSLAIRGVQERVLFVPPSYSLAVALFFVKI
jgi:hypothetical protein